MNSRVRDTRLELSGPSDVGSSSGRKDVSNGDVLDEGRVDLGSVEGSLEDGSEKIFRQAVLEASLLGLRARVEDEKEKREKGEGRSA